MSNCSIHNYLEDLSGKTNYFYTTRASTALFLLLKELAKEIPGRTIAIPNFICHAPLSAIIDAGWKPLLLDNDQDQLFPSDNELIRAKESGVKVFLWVHMFGIPHESEIYIDFCNDEQLYVIEDACLAFGTKVFNNPPGHYSDAVLFSFGTGKQLDFGGGGALFTDKEIIVDQSFKKKPIENEDTFKLYFYNQIEQFNKTKDKRKCEDIIENYIPYTKGEIIPPINTSFNLEEFEKSKAELTRKYDLYTKHLKHLSSVKVYFHKDISPWRFVFIIRDIDISEKENICELLRDSGIDVSHWYWPVNYFLKDDQYLSNSDLSNSEMLFHSIFQLWITDNISDQRIKKTCEMIINFLESKN